MPLSPQSRRSFLLTVVLLLLTGCIDPCVIKGAACAPTTGDQSSINLLTKPTATSAPMVTPAPPVMTEPSHATLTEPMPWIDPSFDPTVVEESLTLSAGEERTIPVMVNGSFLFLLLYGAMPLTITLVDPTGWVITPERALIEPSVRYRSQQGYLMATEGWSYLYQIANPVAGEWQIVLTTEAANKVSLYGTVKSAWQVQIEVDQAAYRPGDLVTVQARLTDGDRLQIGATITGTVILPDGAHFPLTFTDDGTQGDATAQDGRYTAQFTAPGYNSHLQIDLRARYDGVVRQESTSIEVVGPTATLQQISGERAVDANGNGLYERLELDLLLAVQSAGAYEFQGTLVDSSGKPLAFALRAIVFNALPTGLQTITLTFDGAMLHGAGSDGPYTLTDLVIKYSDQTVYAPFTVGVHQNVYTTATYNRHQFEDQ
ncbi:MAG: hypothetical protein DYG89_00015 [Caldilinea sp. CFX5]|nr:hypothetical protein [Caldilinea sp. CFX5]